MKTINELLHRWAELEPGVCSLDTDSGQAFFWHDGDNSIYIDMLDDPYDKFMLAGFVQQAVDGQGLRASIRIGAVLARYRAEIMFTINGHEGMVHADSDDSPAHALLAAYIKALEAVAEVA